MPTTIIDSSKRDGNRGKGKARNRRDRHEHEPVDYYRGEITHAPYKGYRFSATLIRPEVKGKAGRLSLTPVMTALNWEDGGVVKQASMSLQNPRDKRSMAVRRGHQIQVRWAAVGGSNWHPLWRLRVTRISENEASGTLELTLEDEMKWMLKMKEDFSYKKGKAKSEGKRPKGWRADQIARDVCRKYGIRIGRLVKGRHYIENLTEEGVSPIKIIEKAYALDRDETGRKFVIGIVNGKLEVTLLRRRSTLLRLGPFLLDAVYEHGFKKSFATVLSVKANAKREKGKKKKLEIEVKSSKAALARYGTIRAVWNLDDPVSSEAKLRERGRRRLEHIQEPDETLSLTVPGLPLMQKGDAMKVKLPQNGLYEIVYARSVSHSVTSDDYTCQVECDFTDPFKDEAGDKIRQKICKEARKRKRKEPSYCSDFADVYAPPKQPKKKRRDRRPSNVVTDRR